nr:uncharacterized protein LOC129267971 [Lytechinus pictus]
MVETRDIAKTEIKMTESDSLREKCEKLCVEDALQLSVAVGMVELSGSGDFLGDERRSAKTQSKSLIYKLSTVKKSVKDLLSQQRNIIDSDVLSDPNTPATHVVVGIDWGAQCTVTCEYENFENDDVSAVRRDVGIQLGNLRDIILAQGATNVYVDDKGKAESGRLSYKCRADVLITNGNIPVKFEGALGLAMSLPTFVKNTSDGKGVPVKYYLLPVEAIRKMFNVKSAENMMVYKEVDECTIQKIAQVLEKVKERSQKIYDIYHDIMLNGALISDEVLGRIDTVWEDSLFVQESRFKTDLQEIVKRLRSGEGASSVLEKFLSELHSEKLSALKYEEEFEPYQKKVGIIRPMLSMGIKYIGRNDELVIHAKENTFVFYIPKGANVEFVEKNRDLFMRFFSKFSRDKSSKFIVVDQEIVATHIWQDQGKKPTIKKYENGVLTIEDLFGEEGEFIDACMVQIINPQPTTDVPNEPKLVTLRCPNALGENGGCAGDPSKWRCSKCKRYVQYFRASKLFYCKCGMSSPQDSKFRCSDPRHGMDFVVYPKVLLEADLSQLEAMKEMNILILGETGVGKSTWINGIQNYLSFNSLHEAMSSDDFPVLIPSSFTLTQDGKQRKIKIGKDDPNEVQETGKSATKEPRSYVFTVGHRRVRLIDTPGIGDADGYEQDEINMKSILSHLTSYSQIHAICILLKPNNARLTVMFRFCIQELLVQLHKSAKNNIVFCFTNARQTFYQPGDTLPVLNEELRKKNVGIQATKDKYFCFDNEPFRFLACTKNDVKFGEADIATYSSSWDKSVEETWRLLDYIELQLKPHRVRDTVGLNEARRIVIAMSKPLAEVANTINHNLDAARETKAKIGHANTEMNSLIEDLTFKGYDLVQQELRYPMTVCAAPECVTYIQVGQTKVQNTVYKTVCHRKCYLKGVPIETTGNPKLANCLAMTNQYCNICTHSYQQHMHLTYILQIYDKEFLSTHVQQQINKIRDSKAKKEAFINEINKKVEELNAEQKIILATAAKFWSFLEANALITHNDAVEEYLEMCIKQEKAKLPTGRKEGVLENMITTKAEYKKQREIINNAITGGANENIKTPAQNGITFGEAEIATYSSSWDKSVEETHRLLQYVECQLKPHRVRDTVGMNEARRIIIAMSKPLAEVANTINHNIDAARETKAKIALADNEISSLRADLKFKGYDIKRKEVGYPKTVCAAPECVTYIPVGRSKVHNTVYKTVCHSNCRLKGVPIETTGNPKLAECWAMTDEYCRECGHNYKQHMHLTYEIVITEKEFLSSKVQHQINKIRDTKSRRKAMVDEINKKIKELKEEQEIIMETGAKFGSFLRANALITYNDAVDEYL